MFTNSFNQLIVLTQHVQDYINVSICLHIIMQLHVTNYAWSSLSALFQLYTLDYVLSMQRRCGIHETIKISKTLRRCKNCTESLWQTMGSINYAEALEQCLLPELKAQRIYLSRCRFYNLVMAVCSPKFSANCSSLELPCNL